MAWHAGPTKSGKILIRAYFAAVVHALTGARQAAAVMDVRRGGVSHLVIAAARVTARIAKTQERQQQKRLRAEVDGTLHSASYTAEEQVHEINHIDSWIWICAVAAHQVVLRPRCLHFFSFFVLMERARPPVPD